MAVLVMVWGINPSPSQTVEVGQPPGRLVDVGDRKIHMICTGSGSPTVILESGASAFAIDWTLVQREIAQTNRVCSYDRAGIGFSDLDPDGLEAHVVRDLHEALEASGENPPYVMVGASRGGLFVRLYQDTYPDQVVGFVLVDPAHEDRLFTLLEEEAVPIASLTAEQRRSLIPPGPVRVPRRSPQTGPPFDRLPRELYELRIKLDAQLIASIPESVPHDAVVAFAERERTMLARLKGIASAEPYPLGDQPLLVLTRGIESSQELEDIHGRVARTSRNSRHSVVAGSGHEIHLFKPGAVIEAIQEVVESVRTGRNLAR